MYTEQRNSGNDNYSKVSQAIRCMSTVLNAFRTFDNSPWSIRDSCCVQNFVACLFRNYYKVWYVRYMVESSASAENPLCVGKCVASINWSWPSMCGECINWSWPSMYSEQKNGSIAARWAKCVTTPKFKCFVVFIAFIAFTVFLYNNLAREIIAYPLLFWS